MSVATVPAPPATWSLPEDDVVAAQAGDSAALERVLRDHMPAVTAVCRRRLGRRAEAEDAVQETMERALRSLDGLRDTSRVGPWLCRIAERVCLDVLRGERHMVDLDSQEVIDPTGPDELAERWDEARQLHAGLERLGDRPRKALWLRDALGVPVPAVAQELGVTEGSARVLLCRARQQLRAQWAGAAGFIPGLWLRLHGVLAKAGMTLSEGVAAFVPLMVIAGGVALGPLSEPAAAEPPRVLLELTPAAAAPVAALPAAPLPAATPAAEAPAAAPLPEAPAAAPAPAPAPAAAQPAPAPAPNNEAPSLQPLDTAPQEAPAASAEGDSGALGVMGLDVFAGDMPEAVDEVAPALDPLTA